MATGKNRKKVLIVGRMPQAGIDRAQDARRCRLRDPDRRFGAVPASQAQGRQRRDAGRHAVPPGRARRRARHDGGGPPGRRLRRRRDPRAQQAQDPADDHRHRQFGVGGRARHVHAAGLGAAHPQARPLRARERLAPAPVRPAGRPRRQVDPGGRHGPHRLAHREALRGLRDGCLRARPQHLRGRHREGRRHQGHRPQGHPAQGRFRVGALPQGAGDGEHVQRRDDRR